MSNSPQPWAQLIRGSPVHASLTHRSRARVRVFCAENDRNLTPPSTCSSTFIIKTNLGQNKWADWARRGSLMWFGTVAWKKKRAEIVFFCASLTYRGEKTCDHSEQKKKKRKEKAAVTCRFHSKQKKGRKNSHWTPPTPAPCSVPILLSLSAH